MEQLVNDLTLGNPYEVKAVLASVAAALAVYQLVLIAIGYGKVRPPFLGARVASFTHRASGDVILVLVVVVALACLARFGTIVVVVIVLVVAALGRGTGANPNDDSGGGGGQVERPGGGDDGGG
jgi:uncharacterized membrane protein YgcG